MTALDEIAASWPIRDTRVPKRPRSPYINYNLLRITDVSANLAWEAEQREIEAK